MGFVQVYLGIYGGGSGSAPPAGGARTDIINASPTSGTGLGASSGFVGQK